MSQEPQDKTLTRLCELQQLQLEKLDAIAKQLSKSDEVAERSHEEYLRQTVLYEQSLREYQSSDRLLTKVVTWRAILVVIMLGLIALAVVSR